MFDPIHLLPNPFRSWIYILVAGLWFVPFLFGTIRFVLQREWELATFAGVFTLLAGLAVCEGVRRLRELGREERL